MEEIYLETAKEIEFKINERKQETQEEAEFNDQIFDDIET